MLLTIFHDDHSNLENVSSSTFFLSLSPLSPETLVTIFIAIARSLGNFPPLEIKLELRSGITSRNSPHQPRGNLIVRNGPIQQSRQFCPMVPPTHWGESKL